MFFILPINTDCPIYHFPAATLGVIAANLLIHAGVVTVGESGLAGAHTVLERWCLWAGDGYHPEQWITSAFLHMDWLHVIGNCLFLWGFGLIVEGKLGWWRFLLLYLGIAAVRRGDPADPAAEGPHRLPGTAPGGRRGTWNGSSGTCCSPRGRGPTRSTTPSPNRRSAGCWANGRPRRASPRTSSRWGPAR